MRIALKIDIDTCRGALLGVPPLLEVLQRHAAAGSFFCALGPDHSGRQAGDESLAPHYDLPTRLYGMLLPAPDIGRRAAETFRQVRDAGFEVAIHAWNRVRWESGILAADNDWVEAELALAVRRFQDIFAETAFAHAAAGWRSNRHALRLTQRLGFCYASDCRGKYPFIPVIDGEIVHCPQLPTTLPTLDEVLAQGAVSSEEAAQRILAASDATAGDHVFTLRAELEGRQHLAVFERLLAEWGARGYQFVTLRDLLGTRNVAQLPRHSLIFGAVPGRPGRRLLQGPPFLQEE